MVQIILQHSNVPQLPGIFRNVYLCKSPLNNFLKFLGDQMYSEVMHTRQTDIHSVLSKQGRTKEKWFLMQKIGELGCRFEI
jgi:hypothetical protein